MRNKYKTQKVRRQHGRGILRDGIKTEVKIGDQTLPYKKKYRKHTSKHK